jgi:hypothetical protein
MHRSWVFALGGFLLGSAVFGGAWALMPRTRVVPMTRTIEATAPGDGDLQAANANLVAALHACDANLEELRSQTGGAPAPSARPSPVEAFDAGNRRRAARGEPSAEDWERMAQLGTVRVRIPCLRDTPWTPPARTLDRLGLAPADGEMLRGAYEQSNKRVMSEIRPLCAKVLGSAEMADKVGPSTCVDAIVNSARRTSADATKQSLTRVAEVNAGKREAPKQAADAPEVEQLLLALSNETRAFEADLAKKVGPEEAKRLAWAPEMCADRRTIRATDGPEEREGAGGRP